ncbi:MAG TPA: hypothetical protein VN515_00625 [Terriglobales bacterium]|nr:hypothetical protein [Terriglobales bacterium]
MKRVVHSMLGPILAGLVRPWVTGSKRPRETAQIAGPTADADRKQPVEELPGSNEQAREAPRR